MISDFQIGKNVTDLRQQANMSMEQLAEEMRKRGHTWTRITVFNVEHAKRQLKFQEAMDMLGIFGMSPDEGVTKLLSAGDEERAMSKAIDGVSNALDSLFSSLVELRRNRNEIKQVTSNALKDEPIEEAMRGLPDLSDSKLNDLTEDGMKKVLVAWLEKLPELKTRGRVLEVLVEGKKLLDETTPEEIERLVRDFWMISDDTFTQLDGEADWGFVIPPEGSIVVTDDSVVPERIRIGTYSAPIKYFDNNK